MTNLKESQEKSGKIVLNDSSNMKLIKLDINSNVSVIALNVNKLNNHVNIKDWDFQLKNLVWCILPCSSC